MAPACFTGLLALSYDENADYCPQFNSLMDAINCCVDASEVAAPEDSHDDDDGDNHHSHNTNQSLNDDDDSSAVGASLTVALGLSLAFAFRQ